MTVGALAKPMARLALAETPPLSGCLADLTGTGTRFRAEDVQAPLRDGAGLAIDVTTMEVFPIGARDELIQDVLRRQSGGELPPDPGVEALPSSHTRAARRVHA